MSLHPCKILHVVIHVDHVVLRNNLHRVVQRLKNMGNRYVCPSLLLYIHLKCVLTCPHRSRARVKFSLPYNLAIQTQKVLLHRISKTQKHCSKSVDLVALCDPNIHPHQRWRDTFRRQLNIPPLRAIVFVGNFDGVKERLMCDISRGTSCKKENELGLF